ncbi:hypothetical protein AB1K70_23550 [Bremerella sp. JC770]|uniref:hypothetical protein n=1 Tax=Bremerella sp. JC770 TaxID=3232137 RepID=UPI00345A48A5
MSHQKYLLLVGIAAAVCAAGCTDPGHGPGSDVQGSVTWKSKPLEQGIIYFVPSAQAGSGTSLEIRQGRFSSTDQVSKLQPGTYRIEITSSQPTGKLIPGAGPNGQVEEVVQIIPPSYNEKSKLSVDVTDSELNQFQFDLTAK